MTEQPTLAELMIVAASATTTVSAAASGTKIQSACITSSMASTMLV
mgnify:CR=1 FL=1